MAGSPTTICFGRNVAVSFFSFILPLSIISAVATSVLVVLLRMFIKVYIHTILLDCHWSIDIIFHPSPHCVPLAKNLINPYYIQYNVS